MYTGKHKKNAEKGNSVLTWKVLERICLFTSFNDCLLALLSLCHGVYEKQGQRCVGCIGPFSVHDYVPGEGRVRCCLPFLNISSWRHHWKNSYHWGKNSSSWWYSWAVKVGPPAGRFLHSTATGDMENPVSWIFSVSWCTGVPASPLGTAISACCDKSRG